MSITKSRDWGDGSVGEVFLGKYKDLSPDPQQTHKWQTWCPKPVNHAGGIGRWCIMWTFWPAFLAEITRFNKRLAQKIRPRSRHKDTSICPPVSTHACRHTAHRHTLKIKKYLELITF